MPQYPNVLAGQRITADLMLSMLPTFVVKPANTDRASTATPADDPDMTVQLEANAVYHIEIFVHYAAITAAGFQTTWNVPAGASGLKWSFGSGSTQVARDNVPMRVGVHGLTVVCEYGDGASASNQLGAFEQGVVTTTNAGTFALSWSQAASNATATRVGSGSFLRVTRLG